MFSTQRKTAIALALLGCVCMLVASADSHMVKFVLETRSLHDEWTAVAEPGSSRVFMSRSELAKLRAPDKAAVDEALQHIRADPRVTRASVMPSGNVIVAHVVKAHVARALAREGDRFPHVVTGIPPRTAGSVRPRVQRAATAHSGVASGEADPNTQKAAYGMPKTLSAPSGVTTSVMVWGPGTYGVSSNDVATFYQDFSVPNNADLILHEGFNGTAGGDNWVEATLDTEMISSFALGVPTRVVNTNDSLANEDGPGFGYAMLDFVTDLNAQKSNLPAVLSLSLGSVSFAGCELMCTMAAKNPLITMEACLRFVQDENRQVCMFPSAAVEEAIDLELQALGLRGVTIVGASGDGGSHYSFEPFSDTHIIGIELNHICCSEINTPTYPASSAYVLGVGGSQLSASGMEAWTASGGGFSWVHARPAFQETLVKAYLAAAPLPPSSAFNASGRGYPDVAAVASDVPIVSQGRVMVVGGTSSAAPTWGGILGAVIAQRLGKGKGLLGPVAPALYKAPADAFTAIEDVSSACTSSGHCCPKDASFAGAPGVRWNPVVGLGTPVWGTLSAYLESL